MKLRPSVLILLAFSALFSSISAQDKAADDVIKVDTALVSIPVIVSDKQGRYAAGLEAHDFTIFRDGVKQNIDFFASTEEPINVALLIDTSRSTADVLGDIKHSAIDFIKLLQPRDKAMVVSFDYEPHILSQLTSDSDQLKQAVKHADIGKYFGTTLRDAVFDVVNESFAKVKGRKAIILLTDGKDAGSSVSTSSLFHSLEESDTLIYTVYFQTGRGANQGGFGFPRGQGGRRGGRNGGIFGGRFPRNGGTFPGGRNRNGGRGEQNNEAAEDFLQKMSGLTGGRYYSSKIKDLGKTFATIVEELRFQYRLGFYPPDDTTDQTMHSLKIKVARPEMVVRAREGYRVISKTSEN